MARNNSRGTSGRSSSSFGGKSGSASGGKGAASSRSVSQARLHQKSGPKNAFGGYTKVNNGDGTFQMRKSEK